MRFGCEPAPLVLGFILGPLMEENLRRSLVLSRGDPMIFLERPISAVLLVMTLVVIAMIVLPQIRTDARGSVPGIIGNTGGNP